MVVYLNLKTTYGVETIDEVRLSDFDTSKAMRFYVYKLIHDYHLSGMRVYKSQRCDSTWKR
jgi:hypothetical protein